MTGRANYGPALGSEPAYDAWTAWGRLAVVPRAGTTLQVSYTRQSADTVLYPYLQMDALFDNADRAGARFEVVELPGGWGTLAAHGYYTRVDHWMTDEFRTTAVNMPRAYSMATRAQTEIAGGRVEIQRGSVGFGAELSRRRWDARTELAGRKYQPQASLPDAVIDVGGAFVSYGADWGARWRFEAGGRLDYASSDVDRSIANTALYLAYHGTAETHATDVLPVGYGRVTWRTEDGWTLGFGLGHAARLPDQQERYYALQRMGSDWVGNPALVPSRNTGIDTELRYARGGAAASISAFAYRVDDHLTLFDQPRLAALPGVMNQVARSYANVDAFVRGLEASASLALARTVFLSGDVAAVRGTTREPSAAGTNLPEMPPARARVRLRWDNARWNAVVEGVGALAQDHVATALNETPTPAFAAANVRGGLRLRQVEITVGVDNVFDAWYAEHLSYQRDPFRSGTRVYEPGRTLSANLSAKF
jgi:iron complex outermembrane receptor protein